MDKNLKSKLEFKATKYFKSFSTSKKYSNRINKNKLAMLKINKIFWYQKQISTINQLKISIDSLDHLMIDWFVIALSFNKFIFIK